MASSAPAAWAKLDLGADMGELDPAAMGDLNPGGLGEPASPQLRASPSAAAAAAPASPPLPTAWPHVTPQVRKILNMKC